MVNWFAPIPLIQSGLKLLVSSLFGNYADRREVQAAIDIDVAPDGTLKMSELFHDLSTDESEDGHKGKQKEELWIDYVSDTGDGFNSTYSVAKLVAQPEIVIQNNLTLKRGDLLVLGGDQVYPTPSVEEYERRFKMPYESTGQQVSNEKMPKMFAIPGNHDWYDGLSNFLKIFCQKRTIGIWQTMQRRSYFALKLPYNYWIWAIDVQLNEEIDEPQKQYFARVGTQMNEGDKVLLITSKPAWILAEHDKEDRSYNTLKYFIQSFITEDSLHCMHKKFVLAAVITGDYHHYSHYHAVMTDASPINHEPIHYIGAGGGGAYLHLTHNLPERLRKMEQENNDAQRKTSKQTQLAEENIKLQCAYPGKNVSRKLLLGNLGFLWLHKRFNALFAGFYGLVYWMVQTHYAEADTGISNWGSVSYLEKMGLALSQTPSAMLLFVLLLISFWSFGDNKRDKSKWPKVYAVIFALLIGAGFFLSLKVFSVLHPAWVAEPGPIENFLLGVEMVASGFIIGGFLFGVYLLTANLIFDNHIDHSSSSLSIEDYKNFLRIKLDKEKLTIYPIKIERVIKNWGTGDSPDDIPVGGLPEYDLIEQPIVIKHAAIEQKQDQ